MKLTNLRKLSYQILKVSEFKKEVSRQIESKNILIDSLCISKEIELTELDQEIERLRNDFTEANNRGRAKMAQKAKQDLDDLEKN